MCYKFANHLWKTYFQSKAEVSELESELEKMKESLTRAHNDIKELEKQRSNLDDMISKLKSKHSLNKI